MWGALKCKTRSLNDWPLLISFGWREMRPDCCVEAYGLRFISVGMYVNEYAPVYLEHGISDAGTRDNPVFF